MCVARAASPIPRDLRLDFFRGLALLFIFVDHIPRDFVRSITLHSFAFSDAAEVFIFISGYTAALVYGRSLDEKGALYATARIFRRVRQLYVAHIFLFLMFLLVVHFVAKTLPNPRYTIDMGLASFADEPYASVLHALMLTFQPSYMTILPLYIVLLGCFPPLLILFTRHQLLPLALSAVLYSLTLRYGWNLPSTPLDEPWVFNPFAWQLLFVIGATAGYHRISARSSLPLKPWLGWMAIAATVAFAIVRITAVHRPYDLMSPFFAIPVLDAWDDKTGLAPLRLLNFICLVLAVAYIVRPDRAFLRSWWARPVILCGQESLYIFCLGTLLSVLGHFILTKYSDGALVQTIVTLGGVGIMVVTAKLLRVVKTAPFDRNPVYAPVSPAILAKYPYQSP